MKWLNKGRFKKREIPKGKIENRRKRKKATKKRRREEIKKGK